MIVFFGVIIFLNQYMYINRKKKLHSYSNPGSNQRHFACKANVITTTIFEYFIFLVKGWFNVTNITNLRKDFI